MSCLIHRAYIVTKIICQGDCYLWSCCGSIDYQYHSFVSLLRDEVDNKMKDELLKANIQPHEISWIVNPIMPKINNKYV